MPFSMFQVSCIKKMSAVLRRDVCAIDAPSVLAANVQRNRVEHSLPPEVQYACVHWYIIFRGAACCLGTNHMNS